MSEQENKIGKLETTSEVLLEAHGEGYKNSVRQIKLEEITPGVLSDNKRGRPFINQIRQFLDKALGKDGSGYFFAKNGILAVFMPNMDEDVAELKVKAMSSMIVKLAQRVGPDGSLIGGGGTAKKRPAEKLVFKTEAGSKRLHLPEGELNEEAYSNWLSKAAADIEKNSDIRRIGEDINVISEQMAIKYQPVYFAQNKLISGYLCMNYKPLLMRIAERQALQDIAVLGTAVKGLYQMSEKGQQFSLMFISFDATTFKNKIARNFYNLYCRNLPKSLKKYIIFSVSGLQEHKLDGEEWDDLRALVPHCRSMVMDTGFKMASPVKFAQVNFSSFGFNVGAVRMPEDAISATITDYAKYYTGEKKTSFVFNISDKGLRDKAMQSGITYVSGPAVLPAQDQPGAARVVADLDAELAASQTGKEKTETPE